MAVRVLMDPLQVIAVNPLGPYCSIDGCGKYFSITRWRRHYTDRHKDIVFQQKNYGMEAKLELLKQQAMVVNDKTQFAKSHHTFDRQFCFGCLVAFKDTNKLKQHRQAKGNSNCTVSTIHAVVKCLEFKCGRFFPVNQNGSFSCNQPTSLPLPLTQRPGNIQMSLTSEESVETIDFHQFVGLMPDTYCGDGVDDITQAIEVYSDDPAITKSWAKILHQRFVNSPDFDAEMKADIKKMDPKSMVESNEALSRLRKLFMEYMHQLPGLVTGGNQGNWRSLLVKFVKTDNDDGDDRVWNFTERKSQDSTLDEFLFLICFLEESGNCVIFEKFKAQVMASSTFYLKDGHRQGIIPQLLFDLADEDTGPNQYPWICNYAQSRCFCQKGGELKLKSPNSSGKVMANILYMLRAGICGFLLLLKNCDKECGDGFKGKLCEAACRQVQQRAAVNFISPWLGMLRQMDAIRAPKTINNVASNGDIICNQVIFKRDIWEKLIPKMHDEIAVKFGDLFVGNTWKAFLKGSNELKCDGNWTEGNISVINVADSSTVPLKSLSVSNHYNESSKIVQELFSLFEFAFSGLGCGSERFADVGRLMMSHLTLDARGLIYFHVVHQKKGNIRARLPKQVKHRLSLLLSRLYLLFRQIVLQLCTDKLYAVPKISERSSTMLDAVAKIFGLDRTVLQKLDVRHFWTNLSNIIFPDENSLQLVANSDLSKMANHTHSVHKKWYATRFENSDEKSFQLWHEALGDPSVCDSFKVSFEPISVETQLMAVRNLVGQDRNFRSKFQQAMIDYSCNSHCHKMISMACGEGKTMAVLAPAVAELISSRCQGTRLFVVPYNFLLKSLEESINDRLGFYTNHLHVVAYTGADINDGDLPAGIGEESDPPNIILLSLTAAANLIRFHSNQLKSWAKKGQLRGVFLDEVQCLISEFNFRIQYQYLNRFSQLCQVPVTCMSGSLPVQLIPSVFRFLRLHKEGQSDTEILKSLDLVNSGDPIGDGFDLELVECQMYAPAVSNRIKARRTSSSETHIHVICCSTLECTHIQNKLNLGDKCVVVTSKNTPKDQQEIARRWYVGEIDVLVSSTVALVGNENRRCKHVMIVGILFDVSNLVQAIGRLRPEQRGLNTFVTQFISSSHKTSRPIESTDLENRYNQMLSGGLIRDCDREIMQQVFHPDSYRAIFLDDQCYLVTASKMFGYKRDGVCKRCTWCHENKFRNDASGDDSQDPGGENSFEYECPETVNGSATTKPQDEIVNSESRKLSPRVPLANFAQLINNPYYKRKPPGDINASQELRPKKLFRRKLLGTRSAAVSCPVTLNSGTTTRLVAGNSKGNNDVGDMRSIGNQNQDWLNGLSETKRKSHDALGYLRDFCGRCKKRSCDGSCAGRCFTCASPGHVAFTCPFLPQTVTKKSFGKSDTRKATAKGAALRQDMIKGCWCCVNCYVPYAATEKRFHGHGVCRVKKRVWALIVSKRLADCQSLGGTNVAHDVFIRNLYATNSSFDEFMASFNFEGSTVDGGEGYSQIDNNDS